jgi:hypothetical protein
MPLKRRGGDCIPNQPERQGCRNCHRSEGQVGCPMRHHAATVADSPCPKVNAWSARGFHARKAVRLSYLRKGCAHAAARLRGEFLRAPGGCPGRENSNRSRRSTFTHTHLGQHLRDPGKNCLAQKFLKIAHFSIRGRASDMPNRALREIFECRSFPTLKRGDLRFARGRS